MNIKDYIYLDETLLNSSLAQFESGLVQGLSQEAETQETLGKTISSTSEGGLDGILGFGAVAKYIYGDQQEATKSDSQKEIINSIIHDHAVDVLMLKIEEKSQLVRMIDSADEGDFVLIESLFQLYDFEYLENTLSPDSMELIHSFSIPEDLSISRNALLRGRNKNQLNKTEKIELMKIDKEIKIEQQETAKSMSLLHQIHLLGKLGKNIFPNSIVLSISSAIALGDIDNFRMNKSQLALLNDSKRKIKILGKIIGIKGHVAADGDIGAFDVEGIGKIPTFMSDMILGNFNIIKENDKLIQPIAIYFE